jgi:transcriptional regulator with XRE-family HTH domain
MPASVAHGGLFRRLLGIPYRTWCEFVPNQKDGKGAAPQKRTVFAGKTARTCTEVRTLCGVETLGERLQRLIDERQYGKPLSKIASEAGVDLQTLQNLLSGKTEKPRHNTLVKLADYLQVSVGYLLTGEGLKEPPPAGLPEIRAKLREIQALVDELTEQVERSDGNR